MANKRKPKRNNQPRGTTEDMAIRIEQSLRLRIAGATLHEIGRALSVSHETARTDLARGLALYRERAIVAAEELRTIQLERLEMAIRRLAPLVMKHDGRWNNPATGVTENVIGWDGSIEQMRVLEVWRRTNRELNLLHGLYPDSGAPALAEGAVTNNVTLVENVIYIGSDQQSQ